MKTHNNEFFDRVKGVLKRIPGIQGVNKARYEIVQIRELSNLIKENRIVVLHPYSTLVNDDTLNREIVQEVVKDFLDVYGIICLRRTTAAAMDVPGGAILLHAPLALLKIPSSHEEYLAQVGAKTRNMIRKVERQGYEFKEFVWNEHLEEIYEINISKEIRLGEPMRGWYREPVQPRNHSKEELQYRKYYGAFKDGILYAYLHIVLCGDFAFFKHFIGHAQHLTYGIMNGLLSWTVREYAGNCSIQWLKYGEFSTASSTVHSFRKHSGFKGYAILLDLKGDQELLKYSVHKVRTIWRL